MRKKDDGKPPLRPPTVHVQKLSERRILCDSEQRTCSKVPKTNLILGHSTAATCRFGTGPQRTGQEYPLEQQTTHFSQRRKELQKGEAI